MEVDAGVRHYFPRDLVLHHAEEGPVVHHGGLHEPPAEVAVDVHEVLVDRLLQEVLRAFGGRPPPRADGLEPTSGGGGDKRGLGMNYECVFEIYLLLARTETIFIIEIFVSFISLPHIHARNNNNKATLKSINNKATLKSINNSVAPLKNPIYFPLT